MVGSPVGFLSYQLYLSCVFQHYHSAGNCNPFLVLVHFLWVCCFCITSSVGFLALFGWLPLLLRLSVSLRCLALLFGSVGFGSVGISPRVLAVGFSCGFYLCGFYLRGF